MSDRPDLEKLKTGITLARSNFAQIEADVRAHGRSTILERITQEKRAGGCDCVRTNPRRR